MKATIVGVFLFMSIGVWGQASGAVLKQNGSFSDFVYSFLGAYKEGNYKEMKKAVMYGANKKSLMNSQENYTRFEKALKDENSKENNAMEAMLVAIGINMESGTFTANNKVLNEDYLSKVPQSELKNLKSHNFIRCKMFNSDEFCFMIISNYKDKWYFVDFGFDKTR